MEDAFHGFEDCVQGEGFAQKIDRSELSRRQFHVLRPPGGQDHDRGARVRRIHALDPRASVMILTAWGAEDVELAARQLGAVDFLSKALSLDTILKTMERILHPSEDAGQPSLQADSILLVDDNPKTRARYAHALRDSGYELRLAPDAFAALQVLEKESPGLVVLDLDMPDRLWGEVLYRLRERNYRGGLILLTSRQSRLLVLEAAHLGSIDVLHKQ